jgi:hypothetical protein
VPLYPTNIQGRHAATISQLLKRVTKLESRTGAIDSGFPLATLPAKIDPAYTGSGNPKAYINGSSTLTGPYAYLGSYKPAANDTVLVQPVGAQQAYVITGTTTPPASSGASTAWQTVSMQDGFSGDIQYRFLDSAGISVQVTGAVTLPGGSSVYNDVVWGSVGAGYVPVTTRNWPCVPLSGNVTTNPTYTGYPHAYCDDGGGLWLWGIPGTENGQSVDVSGIYAL